MFCYGKVIVKRLAIYPKPNSTNESKGWEDKISIFLENYH